MMEFIKKHKLTIAGLALGALGGFLYWHQIGCHSGTCAITSSPVNSTLYGTVMGFLVANMFKKEEKQSS
jgi:uncharacterized protein YcfJ